MSIDSAITIAWDVFKSVVAPIKRQFGYVIYSKRHAQDLQTEVDELAYEVDRVHNLAEEARNNIRNVYGRVTEWHASAEKALKEARGLLRDFQEASKTCCYETLPDPKCRYQFSRKAKDKIEVIQRLTQKCREFKELNDISSCNPASGNVAALTPAKREGKDVVQSATVTASASFTSTSNKVRDNGVFESRASIILDIMDALADDSNSVVGVYGMGGVGKSTLLADVKGRMIEKKSFDWVAKADVSEIPDIKEIQGEIAHALGLTEIKNEEIVSVRAELLHKRLENEKREKKKVLIILDNLWKGLDLKSVGIPCGHDNKVIGCKLLLTSRFQDVLREEMVCDRDFRLDELKEEEAKRLFERTVGGKAHDDPFKSLVDEALRKCAGLPFLIITVGKLFKYSNFSRWEDTLKQIEMFTNKGIGEKINRMLQLSYDYFEGKEGKEGKSFLRLCVLYGVSKPSLENLVRYGIGLRLFGENSSMKEARNRLSSLIQTLQSSSLLLDDEDADGFKIHDLVRGFVASVASRDDPLLVLKDNDKSVTELLKDKLRSCTAVCFPYVNIKKLPKELDCPEMQIFLLFMNNESLKVPNSCFNSMKKLKVLHLSQVCLTCSPSPFQFLENLHTLCLDGCSLEDVAMIGELKGLQILSFVNSKIQRLPQEIGQLAELRLLDLNNCTLLKTIEPGVLGKLMKLEELYMENSFDQWNAVEQNSPTSARLIELNNMNNLCTLHVSIFDPSVLPEDLNVKKLTKYKIQIGNLERWQSDKGLSTLKLELDPTSDILWKGCTQTLLGKTDDLFLDGSNGIEQSICMLSLQGFPNIKHLHAMNSHSIHYILQSASYMDFKMLESLILHNLINLEEICNNRIFFKSFSALKLVKVQSCNKMEVLFPLLFLRELPQLEEIQVIECPLMREIVEVDDCGKVELCNLHVLKLCDLPNIKNFFTPGMAPSSSASKDQVGTQVAFFNGQQVAFPSLETLVLGEMDNIEIIWDNQVAADSFHKLKSLEVWFCNKLLNSVPSCILGRLKSLESLKVRSCDLLEVVFKFQPLNPLDGHPIAHLPLKTLVLYELPELKCVWDKELHNQVTFQYLHFVQVVRCKNLTSLFPTAILVHLTQLEYLEVRSCDSLEVVFKLQPLNPLDGHPVAHLPLKRLELDGLLELKCVWDKELHSQVKFQCLCFVTISKCKSLASLFPASLLVHLTQLKELKVLSCDLLEVVFKHQPLNPLDGHPVAHLPLKRLELDGLPKLKCVWDKELHSQVKFRCLRFVTVSKCKSLASLFPALVAIHLTQLEELEVRECGIVELIEKEDGLVPWFGFPKLTSLELLDLTELRCIYIRKYVSHWPALKTLKMWGCHNVEILASHPENDMPFDKQPLFLVEKVAFPSLETLVLWEMDNIEIIWDNQVAADSFHKLKSLKVWFCNKLLNIVPSCILGRLKSLESLKVRSCDLLEVVFKLQPLNPLDGHPIAHLPLKRLELYELPELKCVLDKELHSQVKFQCLRFVTVSKCKSLTSLFPASVTIHLTQLEELEVSECGIVELIEKEDRLVPRFVFPKLTSLMLNYLTELKCIYIGKHTSHWPALKTLRVRGCNKVEILASYPENEMPLLKQPLFIVEKGAFSNLQELKLKSSKWMEIWHGNFLNEELFCKLRVLELCRIFKESAMSACHFIQSLTNLEELVICELYLGELSINVEGVGGQSHQLKVVSPTSRCNQHLKTLNVSHCDVSNMFTPKIAGNLVELTKLRISNCHMLIEVITEEGGKEGHVVAFKKLKYMELDGLIGLRCFSSGGHTLMFPLLEDVTVTRCPNMKFFSEGPIEAPKLERVQVSKVEWFWKENLNTTIQSMFEQMGIIAGVKFMRLSEFSKLIEKWNNELIPINSYWHLKYLVVYKCPLFVNAIPSRLMLVLGKMKALQVCDCESLEEIFSLEGREAMKSTQVLPQLESLELVNLPKLRRLWNKNLQGELRFNSLTYLGLYNCSNLRHAFAPSMVQCLANLERMVIKECGQMEGVIAEEEGQGSAMEKITFMNLRKMELECLPHFISFLLGKNYMLCCPELQKLTIAHCSKMRSFIQQSLMEIDHDTPSLFNPQVQFPQLRKMVLSHLDDLSKIWTDNPQETLTFDCLKKIEAKNCKSLENLFPLWVARSLSQIKKLHIESCGLKEIVARGDLPSVNAQFLFPELTSLVLHDMPQLKSFCPNFPTLNWSFLEELQVTHCDKLNISSIMAFMNKWAQRDDQHDLSDHEAHFSLERDILVLERLLLVDKDIQMILDGKFPYDIFGKPKALTLACFHDRKAVFPPRFLLERFQNLQSLEVFCSSFEDIFPNEGPVDEGLHPVLEHLSELKLSKLHNIKCIWREDYLLEKILQSIETFEVSDCPSLTAIFPSMASFRNLTKLVVKNLFGLVHLVTFSAVTNLVHLTEMMIIECEGMKEVMANDGKGGGEVISLEKLEMLRLQNLRSLVCFSSTKSCIFRFPLLDSIEVEECPKMKIFSKGILSTPKLCYVKLFQHLWDVSLEGDLNIAIQKLSS